MAKSNINKPAKKILIVEDDRNSALLIREILRPLKAEIHLVNDGEDAIEFIKRNTDTSLILMDIKLIKMDGYKATSEIRKINPDIPIIAETAYAMPQDREKAINAGCCDYITKPFHQNELFDLVHQYLKN